MHLSLGGLTAGGRGEACPLVPRFPKPRGSQVVWLRLLRCARNGMAGASGVMARSAVTKQSQPPLVAELAKGSSRAKLLTSGHLLLAVNAIKTNSPSPAVVGCARHTIARCPNHRLVYDAHPAELDCIFTAERRGLTPVRHTPLAWCHLNLPVLRAKRTIQVATRRIAPLGDNRKAMIRVRKMYPTPFHSRKEAGGGLASRDCQEVSTWL
jgi:hypothetical protein